MTLTALLLGESPRVSDGFSPSPVNRFLPYSLGSIQSLGLVEQAKKYSVEIQPLIPRLERTVENRERRRGASNPSGEVS